MARPDSQDHINIIDESQTPSAVEVTLTGQLDPRWEFVHAVSVTVEQDEDGSFLVRDPLFLLHGVGETPEEAVRDYKTALVEYYALVEAGAPDNPYDAAMLEDLAHYVRRIPLDSNHAA